jgi:hypothetical protein
VTVQLRNVSGSPLHLGTPDGPLVDKDEVIEVKGVLAKDQPDDAVVIGPDTARSGTGRAGGPQTEQDRAYPTATWAVVKATKENG